MSRPPSVAVTNQPLRVEVEKGGRWISNLKPQASTSIYLDGYQISSHKQTRTCISRNEQPLLTGGRLGGKHVLSTIVVRVSSGELHPMHALESIGVQKSLYIELESE